MPKTKRSPPTKIKCGGEDRAASDSELQKEPSDALAPLTPSLGHQRTKRSYEEMDCSFSTQFEQFKDEIKSLISNIGTEHAKELRQLNATVKDIQQSNHNIEESIAFLSEQNDQLKTRVIQLENKALEDKKHIQILEDKVEELQIESRKSCFVLKDVPKKPNEQKEDLIEMILSLAKTINSDITFSDISDIYRIKSKPDKQNSPIIVTTNSMIKKNNIIKMARAFNIKNKEKLRAKHIGFKTQEETPIYVSDYLTVKGARLHFLARDIAKSKGYKYPWTAYGKVYLRKSDNSPVILLRSEEQAQKLMAEV